MHEAQRRKSGYKFGETSPSLPSYNSMHDPGARPGPALPNSRVSTVISLYIQINNIMFHETRHEAHRLTDRVAQLSMSPFQLHRLYLFKQQQQPRSSEPSLRKQAKDLRLRRLMPLGSTALLTGLQQAACRKSFCLLIFFCSFILFLFWGETSFS